MYPGPVQRSLAGPFHLRQQGGYTVLKMSYASTQHDVGGHARALDR